MRRLVPALALLLVLAACSDDTAETTTTTRAGNTGRVETTAPPQTAAPGTAPPQTAAPATTTTEAPPPTYATRDDPVPLGQSIEIGDWEVTVLSATPDATDLVLEENQFNDPPAGGDQSFIAEIAATYLGDESEAVFSGLSFGAVGDSAVAYDVDASCGVIPDDMPRFNRAFPGGTVTGNLCWHVDESDVDSLVLIAEPGFSLEEAERRFLEIPLDGSEYAAPDRSVPVPEGGVSGERGNPIPAGVTAQIGEWEITVLGSDPDATDAVLAENFFNDPPPDGYQSFMVEISATYLGSGSSTTTEGLSITVLGESSVEYNANSVCGVIPDPLDTSGDVLADGTITGNLCWQVRSSDADSLLVMVEPGLGLEGGRVFLATQ